MAGTGCTSAEHRDHGDEEPGVQVKDSEGKLVYALWHQSNSYRPPVFDKEATYEVRLANRTANFGKPKALKAEKQGVHRPSWLSSESIFSVH